LKKEFPDRYTPLDLARSIGVRFTNPDLLKTALTHPSYVNERGQETGLASNQRLEYLGDSVLGLVINQYLFTEYPDYDEGILARLKSKIVSEDTLAKAAITISLGKYLYLGRGEKASGGENKPSVLADALEAVIAAVYLDQGFSASWNFIIGLFAPYLKDCRDRNSAIDSKSRFQEIVQKHLHSTPVYEIVEETGPDHDKFFRCRLLIDKKEYSQGEGASRKKAEQDAAFHALKKYTRES
jgi:ribonuclease-3